MSVSELQTEYNQWKLVNSIYQDFCQQLCPRFQNSQKGKYEIHNIFERFLTSHHNHLAKSNPKPGVGRVRLNSDLPYIKKMMEELYQKRKFFKNGHQLKKIDIKNKVESILIRVWNNQNYIHTTLTSLHLPIEFANDYLKFANGEVFQRIASDNLNKLITGLSNNKWTQAHLKKMILRYKANLIGSQQWGIPSDVYDHLYSKFGARYEAFASPLNSRFLGKDGGYFCSLFPDTDEIFGSLGSFFNVDMLMSGKNKRIVWSVNPPFVESIMEDTFRKIFKAIEHAKEMNIELIVFGVMPAWYDCRAFLNLKSFYGLKYLEILKKGEYFYEADKQIVARFESVAYVIDSKPHDEIDPEYQMAFKDMIIKNKDQ